MKALLAVTLLAAMSLLASCANPPKVAQGLVISWDKTSGTMSISDESKPETVLEFSLAGAEIGAAPAVGDKVRVAYHGEQGRLTATRVMNISRQKELKGGK